MLRTLSISLALAAPFAVLSAQGGAAAAPAAPACPVDMLQPQPLAIAYLQRGKVVQAKTPDDANKAIKEAMKGLFDDKNKANPQGRDYLTAQFFVLSMEFGGDVQTRGNLGMPGDKAANVDLVVAADSLFSIIEKAQPLCATEIGQWREYKPYQGFVQAAYKIYATNPDSAEKLAKRAQILSKAGPQPYDILWRVAQKKGDEAGMVANLNAAIDKLAGDTANASVRSNFMYNLGRIQMDFADKKTDKAAKAAGYRAAAAAYMRVLKEHPTSDEAPFALSGISSASTIVSDTGMALAAVEVIKAAPSKFSDQTLATAGVLATKFGHTADAVTMFDAASKINPYSRDYLYNLAAMLYDAKRSNEMIPIVTRLVALDPSNSENVMLFAYAYTGLSSNESNAARKKVLIDSVQAFGKIADDMNLAHKVVYTEFDRTKDHTTLRGQVENHGKVARSFTLDFELLGKDGAVLAKQSVTVANVAAGGVGDFVVDVPTGGVLGARYAPLPLK